VSQSKQPVVNDASLTKRERTVGIWLLIFYLIMIAITIATLPYLGQEPDQTMIDRAHDSF
jgi:hypothetical protein